MKTFGLGLCEMAFLQVIYANDNQLVTLPPAIGLLVNLKIFDLSNNKLEYLPSELGDLVKLE